MCLDQNKKSESLCGIFDSKTFNGNYSEEQIHEVGIRFGVSDSSHARVNFAKPYPEVSK